MAKNSIKILKGSAGHFPVTLELAQNKLAVTIHHHQLLGTGSHISCWTYVTHGMAKLKQKEFVFTLKLKETDDARNFSKLPLKIFLLLYQNALQNKRVDIGDLTPLGDKGLLGFAGLAYTAALMKSNELPLPNTYLSCVLLTKEELFVAQTLGLSRVIARMGYEKNRFPLIPWNDSQRRGIALQSVIKGSAIRNLKPLRLKYCTVNLVAGDKVVLVLSVLIQKALVNYFNAQNVNTPICLLTQIQAYHEGCLVWLPDRDSIEMNTIPGATGQLIAGSFVVLAPGKENTGASMLEDGFLVEFNHESWQAFQNAITSRRDVEISASAGDMNFCLNWQTGDTQNKFNFFGAGLDETQYTDDFEQESHYGFFSRLMKLFKK